MKTIFAVLGHLILNVWEGKMALSFFPNNRNWAENIVASILIGIYLETLVIAIFIFLGFSLEASVWMVIAGVLPLTPLAWKKNRSVKTCIGIDKPRWYEYLLFISIIEKIAFGVWQLARTPLYFNDAMSHWSGRGRSLFGAINWSMDPNSPVFLGYTGNKHYPISTPAWRAATAYLNGGWNDAIARVDGILFFILIVITVWLVVWRFSGIRWLSAAATFMVAALPFQIWNAASGYNDIAVESFAVASVAALLRKDWLLAGIFSAGTAWMKNDGFAFHIPGHMLMAALIIFPQKDSIKPRYFNKENLYKYGYFLLGLATLTPWFILKYVFSFGFTPNNEEIEWHSDAPLMLRDRLFFNETHGIFWFFVFLFIILNFLITYKDKTGKALLCLLFSSFAAIFFVFCCTGAYKFMLNETTIHRILLQIYGPAIIVVIYGLWLRINSHFIDSPPTPSRRG